MARRLALGVVALAWCADALSISARNDPIYNTVTPKLRLQIEGYDGDGSNLHLTFVPPISESDYSVVSTGDKAVSLLLKAGKTWPLPEGLSEVTMFVTGASLTHDPKNILEASAVVATVIATPSVMRREDRVVYMTGSPKLLVNGTNFRMKTTEFTFEPPLFKDVDYVLSVKSPTVAQMTLIHGRKWRSDGDPGPLKLTRVDTGAGTLRIDFNMGGVTITAVQADLGAHGVTVETTSDKKVYQSTATLTVLGNGFNTTAHDELGFGNILRWGNALQGRGVNYTISEANSNQLTLTLTRGSKWRLNAANLPGPLTLLAVNAGAGPIPVGPPPTKKGRAVATVYADPSLSTTMASRDIYRTYSHELWIEGEGFTRGTTSVTLEATEPDEAKPRPLREFVDYITFVFNATHLKVELRDDKQWASKAGGDLRCVGIDTGAGPWPAAASPKRPILLGRIVADETHKSGAVVTRTATTEVMYETPAVKKLVISGSDLCGADYHESYDPKSVEVAFDPAISKSVYKIDKASDAEIVLSLREDQRWPRGALYVTSIACSGNKKSTFNGERGVGVATILADPVVDPPPDGELILYRSHSKRLVIHGHGFQAANTQVTLDPTPAAAYHVVEATEEAVTLELEAGASWASESEVAAKSPQGEGCVVRVVQIDTAAGEVKLGGRGVVVATVVAEPEGDVCDDTCEFANDGICDDGTNPFVMDDNDYWDDDYGAYDDDDFDGYYGDDSRKGGGGDDDDDGGDDDADDDEFWKTNEYYDDDRDYLPACAPGTDCTDCQPLGGDPHRDALPDAECDNTCDYARDGMCDDTRTNGFCSLGTDCQDCGPASAGNFTSYDDEFWDDDASNWYRDDEYDDDNDGDGTVFGADDADDWQTEWTDDDDYWDDDDDAEYSSRGGASKNNSATKQRAWDDDDDAVGYVRSVPGPFDSFDDQGGGGGAASNNLLLASGFVVGLPIIACAIFRASRRGRGHNALLPFIGKTDKKTAAELAESWSEMSERKQKKTQIAITPDVHVTNSRGN